MYNPLLLSRFVREDISYLQSAYTKDEEAALKWKEELMAEFPGMEFQQDPLSLSVACHIGAGALAVAWTHKIDD